MTGPLLTLVLLHYILDDRQTQSVPWRRFINAYTTLGELSQHRRRAARGIILDDHSSPDYPWIVTRT